MVEINNQRKAFLDMLAWSEELDNGRQKTRNHGYDVIVGGAIYWLPDHLATVSAKPKLKSTGAGRYQLLSQVGGMSTASSLAWKTFSEKSGRCGIAQIKERGVYLWLIVVDIRQVIDRCSNIWASLPGAGYGQARR